MANPSPAPAEPSEAQIEALRRELVETIAVKEVELQELKHKLLEVQNKQSQAAIERHRAAAKK